MHPLRSKGLIGAHIVVVPNSLPNIVTFKGYKQREGVMNHPVCKALLEKIFTYLNAENI
jgi:hypothetical protein